ncbi:PilZ domain-containing protein [Fusibacter tunisiensis]|uniref:C-di-GMP-binding flagellar brake protein YcgR n=1 Tax=Fusibacter tunisiensis TaxID=1008308 RepID=A0ABS2MS33_9FIRM|nr:PilZ domain-containing protein [Fusibacter tunisiensis]MBM7562167.1 c-di-GMP-binding flagellar brake protein YcgR [Fusibacter tunisiensis]
MKERRRDSRVPYNAVMTIDEVYNQETSLKEEQVVQIKVTDISKGGMGFETDAELPLNFYFNAKIDLGNERFFYSVLRIIRKNPIENGYDYGCEFTGLADILSLYIEDFEEEVQKN